MRRQKTLAACFLVIPMSKKELVRMFIEHYYGDTVEATSEEKCSNDCSGSCTSING